MGNKQRQIGIAREDLPKIARTMSISPYALPGLKLVPETIIAKPRENREKKIPQNFAICLARP